MNLTEKSIGQLKAPSTGNRIVYDGEVPGFGARITAAGVVSFILNYRVHNRERRITIGRAPEFSVAAARDEAIRLRNEIRTGNDPLVNRELSRLEVPMMTDLAERYLTEWAERRKRASSVRNDRSMFEHVTTKIGKIAVAAVTKQDIEKLHWNLRGTPVRANRTVAMLSKAFALAIDWKWRLDNPAHKVARNDEEGRKRVVWLTAEEFERVIQALDNYPDQRAANALRLVILTGSRKGEVLSAKWEDIDLASKTWTKPSHHTKQKKNERVPLNDAATELLQKMKKTCGDDNWLFPGRLGGQHLHDLKNEWAEIRSTAKIPPRPNFGEVRIHDLRHTFGSDLASRGVPIAAIGRLMGHTQVSTTMRYAHLDDRALREAANSFMGERAQK